MGCVYIVINRVNKKRYIGKTIRSLDWRKMGHVSDAKHGRGHTFAKALAKYGPERFEWLILYESHDDAELLRVEAVMIAMFHTRSPRGYNLTNGGDGTAGRIVSAQTRAMLSKRHISAETRARIGIASRGRITSPETRAKLSAAHKGKRLGPMSETQRAILRAVNLGKKHSPETREKMRRYWLGRKRGPRSAETLAKLRAANLGKPSTRKGVPLPDDVKAKISATLTGKPWSAKRRAAFDNSNHAITLPTHE